MAPEAADDADGAAAPVSEQLLEGVFGGFPERKPPEEQSDPRPYLSLFAAFLRAAALRPACAAALEALADAKSSRAGALCSFCPEYGCALVCVASLGCAPEKTARLHLVGPDAWAFGIRGDAFYATADGFVQLYAGSVRLADLRAVFTNFRARLTKAQSIKGDARSAADGKQGHQKTPAFILALLQDALQGGSDAAGTHLPRGGVTDVGLHTGGARRATAWPLAAAVIRVVMEQLERVDDEEGGGDGAQQGDAGAQQQPCYRHAIALFELWLVERALADGALPVGALAHMLDSAAMRGAALADEGQEEMDSFERRASAVRAALAERVAADAARVAAQYVLPPLRNSGDGCIDGRPHRLPVLSLPPPLAAQTAATDVAACRLRADGNLNHVPLLDVDAPASELLEWLRHARLQPGVTSAPRMAAHVRAAGMEAWVFNAATTQLPLFNAPTAVPAAQLRADVADMEAALLLYRAGIEAAVAAATSPDSACGRLLVELRSRETLVAWAVTCLVDRLVRRLHPQVSEFDMALQFADLRHLSLADGLAHDALLAVCAYLRRRTGDGAMLRPAFSLRPNDATVELAHLLGDASKDIQAAWSAEQANAARRSDAHWAAVQKKQAQAAGLRVKLATQREERSTAVTALHRAPCGSNHLRAQPAEKAAFLAHMRLSEALVACDARIAETEQALRAAEQAPRPVVQPLPSDEASALAVLFFLYMPPPLRSLAELSFCAQSALLPRPASKEDRERQKVGALKLDWITHHTKFQACEPYYSPYPAVRVGMAGSLMLKAPFEVPGLDNIGSRHVDAVTTPADGVWHPDGPLRLWWASGRNPFAPLERERMLSYYTATLPAAHAKLQWAMAQDDAEHTDATRGNVALARQAEQPRWLRKPGFLAFGSLRAYPLLQLRKLAVALRERTLPLGHPAVQLLVRQALYHVGSLRAGDSGDASMMTWKPDLVDGTLLPALRHELQSLTDELRDRISDHAALLLVADVLVYLLIFDAASPELLGVRRDIVAIVLKWTAALEAQVAAAADPAAVASLRASEAAFAMYGVLAHGGSGALQAEDVRSLCALLVRAHNGFVFQADAHDPAAFACLRQRCESVMAARAHDVLAVLRAEPAALTDAIRAVYPATPPALAWHELPGAHGCFEALTPAPDVHLLSINALTGAVLLDGSPPRSLPSDVLSHALYQRTFGDRDFEVSVIASGAMRTVRPLNGCFYEFFVSAGRLGVSETSPHAPHPLELLDGTEGGVAAWGAQLPARLRELHSHWLCRASRRVLLRPPRLPHAPETAFLIALDGGGGGAGVHCMRVPRHLQSVTSASDIVPQLTDALVLWDCPPPVAALHKFESAALIHHFVNLADGTYSIELPRFGLEFELRRADDAADGGGCLASKDYAGYALAAQQQLADTLPGFAQCLVLAPGDALLSQHPWGGPVKVLIPTGAVSRDAEGGVHVRAASAAGAARSACAFDVHARFGELRARTVAARLQLAALYAASNTGVPEARAGMTGGEAACALLRKCFVNRPLSDEEARRCDGVAALSRATPAIHLLAHHLRATAAQLAFLHPAAADAAPEAAPDAAAADRLADSVTAYLLYVQRGGCNARRLLTPSEELRVIGLRAGPQPPPARRLQRTPASVVALAPLPVHASFVPEAEARLAALVVHTPPPSSSEQQPRSVTPSKRRRESGGTQDAPTQPHAGVISTPPPPHAALPFPLEGGWDDAGDLGHEMLAELRDSWAQLERLPRPALSDDARVRVRLAEELADVAAKRALLEAYLRDAAAAEPVPYAACAWHTVAHRLRRAAGRVPTATLPDLVRTLWAPRAVDDLNVFLGLSAADRAHLRAGVLIWLQLAVLEDKLTRLNRMAAAMARQPDEAAATRADLVRELAVARTWDAEQHPEWLAFEADGALQIRPAQHAVVQAVLHNPGAIVQLNMGEGKTRVIVPMLVLHWGAQRKLVRLHFLSQLLPEAFEFLHEHLTAGVLGTPLFQLPFHRDVEVTAERGAALLAAAEHCRREGGAAFVTPEARCSLHLKQHELRAADKLPACAALEAFEALPWHDVYDESDEEMRVKYQLVYAVGTSAPLPALAERCAALHALLHALRHDAQADALLDDARIAVREGGAPGAFFRAVRLLPGAALDAALPALHAALMHAVLADPPHELRWLRRFGRAGDVLAYALDASRDADDILPASAFAADAHRDALLTLRGLLAHGVLAHALRQRHRVEYGVAPAGRKRLAVPFRACDVPAERAEFAHPDATLALTTLSYYFDGLSDAEVAQAFRALLTLGPSEQAARYAAWFDASAPGMGDDAASIDAVAKLDLSNVLQRALLCRTFRFSTHVVNFWLTACVLPGETVQYPQRLKATAWHLRGATGGVATGFSGTNDGHRLLPLHVRQLPLPDAGLAATNGHMLSLLLAKARYEQLPPNVTGDAPSWRGLLAFAVRAGAVALIDAGALLAGVALGDAAAHLLQLLFDAGSDLGGVVYFDASAGGGEWVVRDRAGGVRPLKASPLRERDAFVLFDERHCRGADMRLRRDARAVLTLGPRTAKDKIMQAAGRLRQLSGEQSLLLTAQRDVHDSVLASSSLSGSGDDEVSVEAVLRWVMANTIAASRTGLLEWALNGLHFADTHGAPARTLLREQLELARAYAPACRAEEVGTLVAAHAAAGAELRGDDENGSADTHATQRWADDVVAAAARYGAGVRVAASSLAEECERELEHEAEKEEEEERQVPSHAPRPETDWSATRLATGDLPDGAMRLADAVARCVQPPALGAIAWSGGEIWVTRNFMRTLHFEDDDAAADLSLYLRPVDALVALPGGAVLALSEREANALLAAASCGDGAPPALPALLHHAYARDAAGAALLTPHAPLPHAAAARLQLLNGEVHFGGADDEERTRAVAALLCSRAARAAALLLPPMRGAGHLLARSALEELCEAGARSDDEEAEEEAEQEADAAHADMQE
jgi:hypothetical protein